MPTNPEEMSIEQVQQLLNSLKKVKPAEKVVNLLKEKISLNEAEFVIDKNRCIYYFDKITSISYIFGTKEFIDYLNRIYCLKYNNGETTLLKETDFKNIVFSFREEANSKSREIDSYLSPRAQSDDFELYYDLANKDKEMVTITTKTIEIKKYNDIRFMRSGSSHSQTRPDLTANLQDINLLGNLFNLQTMDDAIKFYVLITSFFISHIPHPALLLYGPPGSAKSTMCRMIKDLVDPASSTPGLYLPEKWDKDIMLSCINNWCCFFDNVNYIERGMSDQLCRLVTGGSFETRSLYTDNEQKLYYLRRCLIINGINTPTAAADLFDRSIVINLDKINANKRKTERQIDKEFKDFKPRILGSIFKIIQGAYKLLPTITVENLPRMADFLQWGEAISQTLGFEKGYFQKLYIENVEAQNIEISDGNTVIDAIENFLKNDKFFFGQDYNKAFKVSALFNFINDPIRISMPDKIKDKSFPGNSIALSRKINELINAFAAKGIFINRRKLDGSNLICFYSNQTKCMEKESCPLYIITEEGEVKFEL